MDMTIIEINSISLIWSIVALVVFFFLLYVTAPYGRHFKKGWGPELPNRVGWIIMEAPSLLLMLFLVLTGSNNNNYFALILCLFWTVHYGNRTFVFPFRIHTKGKKMPLTIVLSAVFFNGINAGLNGYWIGNLASFEDGHVFGWNVLLGVGLFLFGFLLNNYCDTILIKLRKEGEKGYKIPFGGPFSLVSCPNFLGELLEWLGFALMAWSLPALSFFLWTFANLIPRSLSHHKWYRKQFPNYPQSRKAIFPYLI
jgi:hypothetical protein